MLDFRCRSWGGTLVLVSCWEFYVLGECGGGDQFVGAVGPLRRRHVGVLWSVMKDLLVVWKPT